MKNANNTNNADFMMKSVSYKGINRVKSGGPLVGHGSVTSPSFAGQWSTMVSRCLADGLLSCTEIQFTSHFKSTVFKNN